ncbi:hypothetical protein ACFYKX_08580 [Cytobacillus sp. FJAT-54145]|uniref:Uncharacterized protein n=1 Tax=Cytobacillus spartinae TaxID=3299023 RepID=A0ABW6K8Z9_9BACI
MTIKLKDRLKTKKVVLGAIGIVLVLAVMIYFDMKKVYLEEEPPIPVVEIDGQQLDIGLGTYRWNGELVERKPEEVMKNLRLDTIDPRARLSVEFPEETKPIVVTYGLMEGHDNRVMQLPSFLPLTSPFPFHRMHGESTVVIQAKWGDGKKADYLFSYEAEHLTPYQNMIAFEEGFYSLLIVHKPGEDPPYERISKLQYFVNGYSTMDNLKQAKDQYPELNIESVPTIVVLDHKGEAFRSTKYDEAIKFLEENTELKSIKAEGKITTINRMFQFVILDNGLMFRTDDIHRLKVGQHVKANINTFHHEMPFLNHTESVEIIKEADPIFLEEKWRPKEDWTYSVLAVGDKSFTKPIEEPDKDDLKDVKKTTIEISLKLEDGSELPPSFMVFDRQELIFVCNNYKDLLKFLFENEIPPEDMRH